MRHCTSSLVTRYQRDSAKKARVPTAVCYNVCIPYAQAKDPQELTGTERMAALLFPLKGEKSVIIEQYYPLPAGVPPARTLPPP